jgi:tripartite-type tricarboxylate transporter receptor subunit TctC
MAKSSVLIAYLFAFAAGTAAAQGFPSKPVTLICPCPPASGLDPFFRSFGQIATKYLGQPVMVENMPGEASTLGPAKMAATARPDGYTLALLAINSFRLPHMRRVSWDPIKDFTYIIGLVGVTFGVVVKSDSQFKTLRELIEYAKANPGMLRYGMSGRAGTPHLVMEELGLKTGAKFMHVVGDEIQAVNALIDGRILAISSAPVWGPHVDSGAFRLLVTFGERRSRWNAPTARELGIDLVSYSPIGIVGPKEMDPKVVKLLHDAFNRTLDDPSYDKIVRQFDLVDWYKSSEDYAEWAVDQFKFQRALVERTIGLGRN